jgi:putative membrane protein
MGSADTRRFPELGGAALSAVLGACAVMVAGGAALPVLQLGPTSGHMALHIALMNVAAPFAAIGLACRRVNRRPGVGWKALWLATLMQMGLLWMSHSPPIHHAAHSSITAFATLHAALFLSAVAFWAGIVASPLRWQAMLALLVSGKLACLLGALLIFSPRVLLVASHAHGNHAAPGPSPLDDQHLAGLLMIAACPLSYVLAAIVLAAHTMTTLERVPTSAFPNSVGAGYGPR